MQTKQDDLDIKSDEEGVPTTSTRRRVIELVGFLLGLSVLGWLVTVAVRDGDWRRVIDADPVLLAGLLGCTVLSAIFNGATFWITVRPVRRLGFLELQGVNLVATLLNYAPIRMGMISRFAWHIRVDGLRLLDVVAWFTSVLGLIAAALVVFGVATAVAPDAGAGWWVLVFVGTIAAGACLALLPRIPLVRRHGRGMDRIFASPSARWGGLVLRILDIGTYAGRIALTLAVLGIGMSHSHVIVLAVVALVANLVPIGRVGFRELAVAWTASRLGAQSDLDVPWEQLALVESGAELLVYLPLGLMCSPWFALGLRRGGDSSRAVIAETEVESDPDRRGG